MELAAFRQRAATNQLKTEIQALVSTQENAPTFSQTPVMRFAWFCTAAVR